MDACEAAARALAAPQDRLLTAEQARACGMTWYDVDRLVHCGRWRSVMRGVYLIDSDVYIEGLSMHAQWQAALLAHGEDVCLVAGSGARALGVQGLLGDESVVEVALIAGGSRHRRQVAGPQGDIDGGPTVMVRQLPVRRDEVVVHDGLRIRKADLTVVDAAIDTDRPTALSLLDSALHQDLVTPEDLDAALVLAKGRPGIQALRKVAEYADGRAQSPGESRLRLCCIDGDVAPDELQHRVLTPDGQLVAIGDLAWLKRRRPLLAESDGRSVHDLPRAVFRDRHRHNAIVGFAYDTIRFTFADAFRPAYVCTVVRAALAAA